MARTRTLKWDPAEHLKSEADIAAYLEAALEDGDPALVAAVLGDIARAKGMTDVARRAGLGRESLYKALSAAGNPELATVLKVVKALGLRFQVRGLQPEDAGSMREPAADSYNARRLRRQKTGRATR
jgi:probable addiction module antidote protein